MGDVISAIPVTNGSEDVFKTRWGSTVNDYKLGDDVVALQDLMVAISEHRANAIESEVVPMTTRMRKRNEKLDKLGTALAELTKIQATFDKDAKGDDFPKDWMTEKTGDTLWDYCSAVGVNAKWVSKESSLDGKEEFYGVSGKGYKAKKKVLDALAEKVKNVIDSLNNESQTDMTRMQSLVDRRDESYSTATTLMSSISDTSSNAIRNL